MCGGEGGVLGVLILSPQAATEEITEKNTQKGGGGRGRRARLC